MKSKATISLANNMLVYGAHQVNQLQHQPGTIEGNGWASLEEIYDFENWRGHRYRTSAVLVLTASVSNAKGLSVIAIEPKLEVRVHECFSSGMLASALVGEPDLLLKASVPKPLLSTSIAFDRSLLRVQIRR
jgi:hypothetical protein